MTSTAAIVRFAKENPNNLNAKHMPPPRPAGVYIRCHLPSSTACARTADGRATSGETNTATTDVSAAEHGRVAEHVGDDEEAHVGTSDVDLVEVGDAAVAGGDGDVLELDVHVVLGCLRILARVLVEFSEEGIVERTIEELAAVGLARGDFESNDVALYQTD